MATIIGSILLDKECACRGDIMLDSDGHIWCDGYDITPGHPYASVDAAEADILRMYSADVWELVVGPGETIGQTSDGTGIRVTVTHRGRWIQIGDYGHWGYPELDCKCWAEGGHLETCEHYNDMAKDAGDI